MDGSHLLRMAVPFSYGWALGSTPRAVSTKYCMYLFLGGAWCWTENFSHDFMRQISHESQVPTKSKYRSKVANHSILSKIHNLQIYLFNLFIPKFSVLRWYIGGPNYKLVPTFPEFVAGPVARSQWLRILLTQVTRAFVSWNPPHPPKK